ncbi:Protein CBG27586 [Caenorhabditis briggsae]|uniref:Protein CBG27586 n=1 Tax=Caenorhabditis briggsae TaxID=6238 RepID=B6IKF6_CAEBR|nr:Protein CBG27586 [Caenorhabditis briggsae]CAS00386.1 Protein CBG27586 [Caenorhabditis briggsae]
MDNRQETGIKIDNYPAIKKENESQDVEPTKNTNETLHDNFNQVNSSFFIFGKLPKPCAPSTGSPCEMTKMVAIDNCTDKVKNLQCPEPTPKYTSDSTKSFRKPSPVRTNWDNSSKIKEEYSGKKGEKTRRKEKSNDAPSLAEPFSEDALSRDYIENHDTKKSEEKKPIFVCPKVEEKKPAEKLSTDEKKVAKEDVRDVLSRDYIENKETHKPKEPFFVCPKVEEKKPTEKLSTDEKKVAKEEVVQPCVANKKLGSKQENGVKIKNNLEIKKEKKEIVENEVDPPKSTYESLYEDEYQYGLSFFRQARIPRSHPHSTSSPRETTKIVATDIDNCTDKVKNLQCFGSSSESTSKSTESSDKPSDVKKNWEDSSKIKKEKTRQEGKTNYTPDLAEAAHNVMPGNYFEPYRDNKKVLYQPHGPSPANYSEEW